ncbi:hypothetical protein ECC02_010429 [Trypanosoma cruzi]|uniref:Uncharacterized protein n=1 Tax=Trypanosoma cruzi TaxID=5693 RepID=A0A7J6XQN4_TRYCR|nr:hypothetical protein ECC02_010429 [Trypanosoma cruzi]
MLTGLPAREMNTKSKKSKEKHGGRVWLCVCGAAGVCQPSPQRKQNKRERNVCSAPQALVARPHVTAPSARRSSRPLLMRAAGEAHRAVVMSVSVGVRVEQLGGKHTAPLTGRVQQETIKEGRVEKKKTSIVIAPKSKKKREWGMKKKKKNKKEKKKNNKIFKRKQEKRILKQLRCSAHAARQDGSGACRAKESTNGPAWVCMHIYNGHIMCVLRGMR